MSRRFYVLLLLCTVALALRLWHLEFQSLWWDEGVSIFLAGQSFRDLTVAKDFGIDLHPPGYHLLLAGWTGVAGPSVFSSRLLSVFAGVMTVPLIARFMDALSRLRGATTADDTSDSPSLRSAALVAGVLAAVSPIDVFYSQESRMYPLLPAIGAISLLATVLIAESDDWKRWLVWVAANVVGMYVFYYFAFLTAAEALMLVAIAAGLRRPGFKRRWPIRLTVSLAGLVVAYVPWMVIAYRRLALTSLAVPTQTEVHLTVARFIADNWQDFTVGFTSPPAGLIVQVVWAAVALIGALTLWRRSAAAGAIVLGAVLVPLAAAGAVLLFRPFYYPRFVLFVLVPLWALTAIGITAPARFRLAGILVFALLVVGNGWTWYAERTAPRVGYAPDDYRTVFATVADRAQSGDVVLGGYPWQAGYARAYLWRFEPRVKYVRSPIDAARIGDLVTADRVWTVTYSPNQRLDPDPLETALVALRPTAVIDQYGDTRVRLFATPRLAGTRMAAVLGQEIGLLTAPTLAARTRPGGAVPVVLRWGELAKAAGDYTVFVHLVGRDGKLWGQVDSPPLRGFFPTQAWEPGADVVDRYSLPVQASVPPGPYQVVVGMYNPHSGDRLPVRRASGPVSDNQIPLGTVTVVAN